MFEIEDELFGTDLGSFVVGLGACDGAARERSGAAGEHDGAIGERDHPRAEPIGPRSERLGPARANDRAMDAPDQLPPAPPLPPAERLPAGARCDRCRYDLVGLAPGEPCPECGLAAPARWPVWDLAAGDAAIVRGLRARVSAIGWIAGWLAFAPASIVCGVGAIRAAEALNPDFAVGWDGWVLYLVSFLLVASLILLLPFMACSLTVASRQYAKGGRSSDEGVAYWVQPAAWGAAVGLCASWVFLFMGIFEGTRDATELGVVALAVAGASAALFCSAGHAWVSRVRVRVGLDDPSPRVERVAAGFAFALVPAILVAMVDIHAWWPCALPSMVAIAVLAARLMRRCARTRDALTELASAPR